MTALHAAHVGIGGGEVGGGDDDGGRFVVTVEFGFESRDGLVELPNDLEIPLPVGPDGVTRWEERREAYQ